MLVLLSKDYGDVSYKKMNLKRVLNIHFSSVFFHHCDISAKKKKHKKEKSKI